MSVQYMWREFLDMFCNVDGLCRYDHTPSWGVLIIIMVFLGFFSSYIVDRLTKG